MENYASPNNPDKKTRHRLKPKEEWLAIPVPPIIDQETFAAAQVQTQHNACMSRRNRKFEYLHVAYIGDVITLEDFKARKAEIAVRRASAEQEIIKLAEQQRILEHATAESGLFATGHFLTSKW